MKKRKSISRLFTSYTLSDTLAGELPGASGRCGLKEKTPSPTAGLTAQTGPGVKVDLRKVREERLEHLQATISHFNNLSAEYDHYALKRGEYLENIDRVIVDQIGRRQPSSYLDVGCGTGRLLDKVKDCFPSIRGFGIDISPHMIEICRAKGLDVIQADFFSFQPATSFDVVFLEFNVFGYLIVQNGLADTIRHLRRLIADRGCLIFDILNPLCLTYTNLRQSLPTTIERCCRLLANRGEYHFTYSVNGNSIAMGLVRAGKVESQFKEAGYKVERKHIKYADHRWLRPLPRLLTSQILFVVSR